jgi:hypothetical protein
LALAGGSGFLQFSVPMAPFGAMFASYPNPYNSVRRYRVRACYIVTSGAPGAVMSIKFDFAGLPGTPALFSINPWMPPSATAAVCSHSGWKTFGQGSSSDNVLADSVAYAQVSLGSFTLLSVDLEAHDFYPSQDVLATNLPSKVGERLIFPTSNAQPLVSILNNPTSPNKNLDVVYSPWQSMQFQLSPFGYILPPAPTNTLRRFRIRACYFSEFVSPALSLSFFLPLCCFI